jgi:drug/metabolite transporter (DMT)-like permease
MLVISLGALLILGGVLFMADQTILGGRLSGRLKRSSAPLGTLEPRERGGGFGLATQWPGFAMIALGALLLLAGAAP